jgi:hypothetical protein
VVAGDCTPEKMKLKVKKYIKKAGYKLIGATWKNKDVIIFLIPIKKK